MVYSLVRFTEDDSSIRLAQDYVLYTEEHPGTLFALHTIGQIPWLKIRKPDYYRFTAYCNLLYGL